MLTMILGYRLHVGYHFTDKFSSTPCFLRDFSTSSHSAGYRHTCRNVDAFGRFTTAPLALSVHHILGYRGTFAVRDLKLDLLT